MAMYDSALLLLSVSLLSSSFPVVLAWTHKGLDLPRTGIFQLDLYAVCIEIEWMEKVCTAAGPTLLQLSDTLTSSTRRSFSESDQQVLFSLNYLGFFKSSRPNPLGSSSPSSPPACEKRSWQENYNNNVLEAIQSDASQRSQSKAGVFETGPSTMNRLFVQMQIGCIPGFLIILNGGMSFYCVAQDM